MSQRHLLNCEGFRYSLPKRANHRARTLVHLSAYLGADCQATGKVHGCLLLLSVGGLATLQLVILTCLARLTLLCHTGVLYTDTQGERDLRARKDRKALGTRLVDLARYAGIGKIVACPGRISLVEDTAELWMRPARGSSATGRPAGTVRQTATYLAAMRNIFAQTVHQATPTGVGTSSSNGFRKRCKRKPTPM